VLMGRKTFESIVSRLGKPLPNRTSVVITRNIEYKVPAYDDPSGKTIVAVEPDIKTALRNHGAGDIFVIGGGEIYSQTIGLADTLYITHIDKDVHGDTRFPEILSAHWRKISDEPHDGYSFAVYKKI
jgi:dihydrofolate reductase